jgi:DNA-binding CsgD family transcriptional regulator
MNEDQFKHVTERLDTITKLLAGNLLKDAETVTQKVEILYNLGISNKEIAILVGTTEQSVSGLKARLKKKRKIQKDGKKSGED